MLFWYWPTSTTGLRLVLVHVSLPVLRHGRYEKLSSVLPSLPTYSHLSAFKNVVRSDEVGDMHTIMRAVRLDLDDAGVTRSK
jgi:hypothetical protein